MNSKISSQILYNFCMFTIKSFLVAVFVCYDYPDKNVASDEKPHEKL